MLTARLARFLRVSHLKDDWVHSPPLSARALNSIYHRCRPQGCDDIGQVFDIDNVDINQHFEEVRRAIGKAKIGNVAMVLGNHAGN